MKCLGERDQSGVIESLPHLGLLWRDANQESTQAARDIFVWSVYVGSPSPWLPKKSPYHLVHRHPLENVSGGLSP
jgi:hypothetical protein